MPTLLYRSSLLAALLCIASIGHADMLWLKDGRVIGGRYEGGTSQVIRFRTDSGLKEYDLLSVSRVRISEAGAPNAGRSLAGNLRGDDVRVSTSFDPSQERIIRDWFSNRSDLRGLPPGLARRESLPPGLARQVQKNGVLPPGLQRRVHPFPDDLEIQLPSLPEGWRRVILGQDVLLMESLNGKIVDLLRNVF
jgi:hypothetical protein